MLMWKYFCQFLCSAQAINLLNHMGVTQGDIDAITELNSCSITAFKMHCATACRALVVIALWLCLSLVLQILIFKVLNMLMGVHWTSPVALPWRKGL